MKGIGEIITGNDLRAIQEANAKLYSRRAFVAPTVYRVASESKTTGWSYYNTLAGAVEYMYFVLGVKGAKVPVPSGAVKFTGEAKAQTLGINVDFFFPFPVVGTTAVPYEFLRNKLLNNPKAAMLVPFRFYKTDGTGPYYSVFANSHLGIAATVIDRVQDGKVSALDSYHRELALLKAKHNTLSLYLTGLSKKKLNAVQQQSFNEGMVMLNNLREEMRKLKGIDITYTTSGQIAEPISLATILIISIVAAAVAWTISQITAEVSKVKKMNAAFDMQKWIAEQKQKLAIALKAGSINRSEYNDQIKSLDEANATAAKVVNDVTQNEPDLFDKAQNLLLIGGGIFIAAQLLKK